MIRTATSCRLDLGLVLDGFWADMRPHGRRAARLTPEAARLIDGHREALYLGIDSGHARATTSATSRSPSRSTSRRHGFSVVRQFVGHGIGRQMHEDPQVPNSACRARGPGSSPG